MRKLLFALALCASGAFAQECVLSGVLTTSVTTGSSFDNRMINCKDWTIQYSVTAGVTPFLMVLEGAPDINGSPGTFNPLSADNGSRNPTDFITAGISYHFTNQPVNWIRFRAITITSTTTVSYTINGFGGNKKDQTSYTTSPEQKAMQSVNIQDFDADPAKSCTGPTHDDRPAADAGLLYLKTNGGGTLQMFNRNVNADGTHTCWFNSGAAPSTLISVPQGSKNLTMDWAGTFANSTLTGLLDLIAVFPITQTSQEWLSVPKCAINPASRGATVITLNGACTTYPLFAGDVVYYESGARAAGITFNGEGNIIFSRIGSSLYLQWPLTHNIAGNDGIGTTGIADVTSLTTQNFHIKNLTLPADATFGGISLVQTANSLIDFSSLSCVNIPQFETGDNVGLIFRDMSMNFINCQQGYQFSQGQSHVLWDNVTASCLSTSGVLSLVSFTEGAGDIEIKSSNLSGQNCNMTSAASDNPVGINLHDNNINIDAGSSSSDIQFGTLGADFKFDRNVVAFPDTGARHAFIAAQNAPALSHCSVSGNHFTSSVAQSAVIINAPGCHVEDNTLLTALHGFEFSGTIHSEIIRGNYVKQTTATAGTFGIAFDTLSVAAPGPVVQNNVIDSFTGTASMFFNSLPLEQTPVVNNNQFINGSNPYTPLLSTVINGSISGSVTCSEPENGAFLKIVICELTNLNGSAVYTYPVPMVFPPVITGGFTTATATTATITGTTSSGRVVLMGN